MKLKVRNQAFLASNGEIRDAIRYTNFSHLPSIVSRQSSVLKGVLMTYKALFWSFYVSFCTFYASLRIKRTVFSRLLNMANNHSSLILNHLYGLHSFAFYILIFDFFPQSLIPRPQSLIPNPSPLIPNPSPLTPNVIVHKYLRAEKLLYNCREDSTTIESSLQTAISVAGHHRPKACKSCPTSDICPQPPVLYPRTRPNISIAPAAD
jgi:hypothetical protein